MINPDLLAAAANATQPVADSLQSRTAARLLEIIDEVDKLLIAANEARAANEAARREQVVADARDRRAEVQRIRNETHALLKTIGWAH